MDEYIEKLLSQIRCAKARPGVEKEIRSHIEDQIADNIASGMDEVEAARCAVADMGDPVEVGISMDKIHKPQMAYGIITVLAVISILAILVQISVHNAGIEAAVTIGGMGSIVSFIIMVAVGFAIALLICFLDYTLIAKYSVFIGAAIILFGLYSAFFGSSVNGVRMIRVLGFPVSTAILSMIYVPVYGAIIERYRNGGYIGLVKALIWLVLPVLVVVLIPNVTIALIMLVGMLTELTVAICKGWFKVPVVGSVIFIWVAFLLLPVVAVVSMGFLELLKAYQNMRIKSFFGMGESFYINESIKKLGESFIMVGNSGEDILKFIPNLDSEYVVFYIMSSYGFLAGLIVISVLAALVAFSFTAISRQKNELGFIMGIGCVMILFISILSNILCAFGIIAQVSVCLPFLSASGSNILVSYVLVGIVLSVFRFKNVYYQ